MKIYKNFQFNYCKNGGVSSIIAFQIFTSYLVPNSLAFSCIFDNVLDKI